MEISSKNSHKWISSMCFNKYEIVGALTEKPADEIGKMKFIWTLHELKESLDKDLIDFFKSSGTATQKAGGE